MRLIGILGALSVFLLTNVLMLGGVAWNRAGEPAATLSFTQCDFKASRNRQEGSPRYLIFRPASPWPQEQYGLAFGAAKPRSEWRSRGPARRGYVLVGHGGADWDAYVKTRKARSPKWGPPHQKFIIVDGGGTRQALRRQNNGADNYVVMHGYIKPKTFRAGSGEGAQKRTILGFKGFVANTRIAIESQFREAFKESSRIYHAAYEKTRAASERTGEKFVWPTCQPLYLVKVNWGRRLEPWIVSVEPIDG